MKNGAPRTVRERVRAELTTEIKAIARRQLAEQGAAALSLRAVARELGMVSSAVYRYFPSRDDLLTALIVDAYEAVADTAERAEKPSARAGVASRWVAVARSIRSWALANPHEYALIYGSPVPGYRAPADTIPSATRVSLVFIRLVADGVASGEVSEGEPSPIARPVHADFASLRDQIAPGLSDQILSRSLLVWTQLFGTLSFELFGHLHNVIHDYDAFFDVQMRRSGRFLVGGT
jgi:AcrR family transcriptional regulator